MSKQQFEIPLKFVSLNEYINKCKQSKGYPAQAYKKKVQADIKACTKLAKMHRIKRPCFVTFTWYEGTRRRDKDNVRFAKKFILDALQEANILPNDNNDYIVGFADYFVYGKGQKVIVQIEEADE